MKKVKKILPYIIIAILLITIMVSSIIAFLNGIISLYTMICTSLICLTLIATSICAMIDFIKENGKKKAKNSNVIKSKM